MAGSTLGNIFKITTWGESHGKALGVVVDGCPAGLPLSEEDIQEVMRNGKNDKLPQKYMTIVEEALRAYVEKVYNILLEHGYTLDVTEIVFVGGGATVVMRVHCD